MTGGKKDQTFGQCDGKIPGARTVGGLRGTGVLEGGENATLQPREKNEKRVQELRGGFMVQSLWEGGEEGHRFGRRIEHITGFATGLALVASGIKVFVAC